MGVTDRDLIKAELQNLQKLLEAKADMSIGAGKMKMLSFANACSGALELLKEREAVKPKEVNLYPTVQYACGFCGHISVGSKDYHARYCPECGRAVKWDDRH